MNIVPSSFSIEQTLNNQQPGQLDLKLNEAVEKMFQKPAAKRPKNPFNNQAMFKALRSRSTPQVCRGLANSKQPNSNVPYNYIIKQNKV